MSIVESVPLPRQKPRRTQRERTETTQQNVLQATLKCLGTKGYHAYTLQDIADAAGISRGAITHHYKTKLELTAEAVRYFVDWRFSQVMDTAQDNAPLDLPAKMDRLWNSFVQIFPITLEIIFALRSDRELRDLVGKRRDTVLQGNIVDELVSGYVKIFSQYSAIDLPESVISVINAFYRGLYIEAMSAPPEKIAAIKANFQDMVVLFLEHNRLMPSALAGYRSGVFDS
jgi:AcrR family transcriptional regulator